MIPSKNTRSEIIESLPVLKRRRDAICQDSLDCFKTGGLLPRALVEANPVVREIMFFQIRLDWLADHWKDLDDQMKTKDILDIECQSAIAKAFAVNMKALTPECLDYSEAKVLLNKDLSDFLRKRVSDMKKCLQDLIDNHEDCEKKWQLMDARRIQMNQQIADTIEKLRAQKLNERNDLSE